MRATTHPHPLSNLCPLLENQDHKGYETDWSQQQGVLYPHTLPLDEVLVALYGAGQLSHRGGNWVHLLG